MQYRTPSMASNEFYTFWFEKNLQGDIVAVYNEYGTKLISYTYSGADIKEENKSQVFFKGLDPPQKRKPGNAVGIYLPFLQTISKMGQTWVNRFFRIAEKQ